MTIYEIIQKLRSDNGRIFKENVLEEHKDNEVLKRVVYLTLEPSVNFYIKKIPNFSSDGNPSYELTDALDDILKLADRTCTGHAGIEWLSEILSKCNIQDAEVIRLVVGRDLKCGVGVTQANKTWPKLILEPKYMRCSLIKDAKNVKWEDGVYSQLKSDGLYLAIDHYEDGQITLTTRSGSNIPIQNFNETISTWPKGFQYQGELLVYDRTEQKILPRQIGNGMINSLIKDGVWTSEEINRYEIRATLWDMVSHDYIIDDELQKTPYEDRFLKLNTCFRLFPGEGLSLIESKLVYSREEAYEHYFEKIKLGEEGTIIKLRKTIWKDYTSKEVFKIKIDAPATLVIVDFNSGTGKNAVTFGSIKCQSSDGLLEVNISGFKVDHRKAIWAEKDSYIGKFMEVTYNSLMINNDGKHSLFLPRFTEFRTDKNEADSFPKIQAEFESIIKA